MQCASLTGSLDHWGDRLARFVYKRTRPQCILTMMTIFIWLLLFPLLHLMPASFLQVYGKRQILALLEALQVEVVDIMLFLKYVERIEVLQWEEGQPQPKLLSACSIANPTNQMRISRSLYVQASKVCLQICELPEQIISDAFSDVF